eukprot:7742-Heterococcus_DN1.PRE.2
MGHESTEFLALFKPSITILKGGIASGFNHVEATAYAPRLMHCKGPRKSVRVTEVPLSRDSLNDGDVFVLDNGLQLYQWNGTQAGVFEKRQGQEIVNSINYLAVVIVVLVLALCAAAIEAVLIVVHCAVET